ncbi:protein-disulfide reductase DsbD [Uliginosibacterium sp. 31-16]|uniref:protein-disulfide reductase DsbD n=1 Tax=Uliginosibacterium sp. 31-16 TaxID=3068315 RepID=UPI00273EC325|nr:protein-disulfide reductase DsbD [Uliginosibacterium sp. 31-16]MDP5238589.1 protein-disulfide reductase DsbD [Uliginosibacterium sp. 31-16]
MKRFLLIALLCFSGFACAASPEPLPPEQAYRLAASLLDEQTIEVRFAIEPGYYLYRNKLGFKLESGESLGAYELPAGLDHEDKFFGKQQIYRDALRLTLPLVRPASEAKNGPLILVVSHQGCADFGICYPPSEIPVELKLANMSSALPGSTKPGSSLIAALDGPEQAPVLENPASSRPSGMQAEEPEQERVSSLLAGGNLFLIALSFFGFGLLLSFTPCTLPMLPILSGIIVGHGHKISHARAFVLCSAYVLGMAVTYALAGVAAGFSGQLLSAWLQNVWVLGAFALLFVILALAMFGVYELQIPARWQHTLSASAHHHGGSARQLALMGAISALIVGPCVAAPLAGALLYIARTHDAVLGGLALFMLGLGMGAPLILIGVAARRFLPKPGPWMEGVKRFFGLTLLATALYLIAPVLPPILPMFGWAALLITGGVFLRALDSLPAEAHASLRAFKAIGIVLLLAGGAILIGALAGSRNPLQPLSGLTGCTAANACENTAPRFERIKSSAELDARIAASSKPVMLDFYADWCVTCKEMEEQTFKDPKIAAQLAGFTLLQADVTANTPADRELLKRFGLFGPPGILFFAPAGKEIKDKRVIGFMGVEGFGKILTQVQEER